MAILTISAEMGSEGLRVGKVIAEEMGYEVLDKEKILQKLKKDGALWGEEAQELDGRKPSLWEKYDWQYRGFVALAQSHMLDCALGDRAVIIGRGGNFLLEGIPHTLRTRIIAPMEARLKKATEEKTCADFICIDAKLARTILEKADRESEEFIRAIYGKSWNDPEAYDITFNMGTLSFEEVIDVLKSMLAKKDKLGDARAVNQLEKRAIAARINAAILTNPAISIPTLEVSNVGEEILLRGVVHGAKEHKLIEEEAKKIAGNITVRCELHYR